MAHNLALVVKGLIEVPAGGNLVEEVLSNEIENQLRGHINWTYQEPIPVLRDGSVYRYTVVATGHIPFKVIIKFSMTSRVEQNPISTFSYSLVFPINLLIDFKEEKVENWELDNSGVEILGSHTVELT